ncbi:SdrD B-like domain-containing protein [Clostridium tertium]|uniref:SdrD B-like domain-containing protein n=1 Tax=Clostridium tertium TaxID=1559 RepID=UPI00232CC015|nr:SdrD B-like domain-containing protein [Clostridium tertium]MDB1934023.1 SdrD B-like domain-containing protein [Clostridium tertium]MDB1937102.1 SdrD B-like domain-containing protein [Clostridium tertium]
MYRKLRRSGAFILMLMYTLVFNINGVFVSAQERSEESSGYTLSVKYNDDNTEATINGNIESINEEIRIINLQDAEGNELDYSNLNYKVSKNGEYEFHITYEKIATTSVANTEGVEANTETSTEQKEETISIKVDGIKQVDNEFSSGYKLNITYSSDKSEATIQGDTSNVPENVKILKIKDKSGKELDFSNLNYKVLENGNYDFYITYGKVSDLSETNTESVEEQKEETISVKVDDIQNVKDKNTENQTYSSSSNLVISASEQNYKEKSIYVLNVAVPMYQVENNHIIKITLPKDVVISPDFESDLIESINKETNDTENIYSLKFKDSVITGSPTSIKLGIAIDQKEYLSYSDSERYTIKAVYQSDGKQKSETSLDIECGTYRKATDFLYVSSENTLVGEYQIKDIKFKLFKDLQTQKLATPLKIKVKKHVDLEYDLDSSWQVEGDYFVHTFDFNSGVINDNISEFTIPFKAKVKDDIIGKKYKTARTDFNSNANPTYEWKHEIETNVSLSFGLKEQEIETPISYSVLIFGPSWSDKIIISNANIESLKRYDEIAGENNINYLSELNDENNVSNYWGGAAILPIQSGKYENINSHKMITADKTLVSNVDKSELKLTVKLTLPSNIEWTGDPTLYDSNTRKVTISANGSTNYIKTLKAVFSSNTTMKVKNVQKNGFRSEVIESLPIEVSATYKGYELEPYIGEFDLKNRRVEVRTLHESANAIQIGKTDSVANYDIKYRQFNMNYNKPVEEVFQISDKYADLKQIKFSSEFIRYLDSAYGEDWSIEYYYRSGDMNSTSNKAILGKSDKITAPVGSRIVEFRIKGKKLNKFNATTIKNGIEFTFDVLKNDRETGSIITEKEKIEVTNFHKFNNTFNDFTNNKTTKDINLYRIQEKAILSINELSLPPSFAKVYEGTTIYGGVYINSDTSAITKPYSPSEDSIEFSFLNTDKIRAKDIWVNLRRGSVQPVVVEYDTNKKTNQTIQKNTTKYNAYSAGTGKFDLQLDEDEYLTRIKVTTNSYFTSKSDYVFIEGIGVKYDVLDTDYITHTTGEKSIETIRMNAMEGDHIYIPEDVEVGMKVAAKTVSIMSGFKSYESEMTYNNDTASIDKPFKVSLSINKLQTGFNYRDPKGYSSIYDTDDAYLEDDPFKYSGAFSSSSTLTLERLKYMIVNPIIYIPVPDGFNFTENSVKIKSGKYAGKTPESKIVKDENGKRYIRVRFYGDENDNTSLYIDENGANKEVLNDITFNTGWYRYFVNYFTNLDLEYELTPTGLIGSGNQNLKSGDILIDWITGYESYLKQEYGSDNKVVYDEASSTENTIIDGKEVEIISDTIKNNVEIPVTSGSSIATDILIEKNGQYLKKTNILGGEQTSLISVINNNSSTSINDITVYIPLKKGISGTNYQWNMELLEKVTANKGSIYYSTSSNPTMNGSADSGYTASVSDWSKVTMIKVTVPSLASKESLRVSAPITNEEKTTKGTLSNEVKIFYQYTNSDGSKVNSSTTDTILELKDNILTGKVWNDINMNGVMDADESGFVGAKVTLWHNNNGVPEKRDTVTTEADGTYSIEKPEIHSGDYLEITLPDGYNLVPEKIGTYPDSIVSHFERTTKKLMIQQGKSENLNAGVYEEQKIITPEDEYTVKVQDSVSIGATYSPDNPKQLLKYVVPEGYRDTLSIDSKGEMTGLKAANDIKVEIYYINAFGDRISKEITVNVVSDNPPILTVPEVLEFNIGDTFDPRDPQIIKGLSVSDDFDNITLDNIEITEDVPREGKLLWLFTTKKTNSLNKVGTYEVLYRVEDSFGNVVEKTLKVKVNGIPYFENDNGDEYNKQNPVSTMYLREREVNFDRYKDLHAYYEKASDTVGENPVKTEIQNVQNYPAQDKGEFTLSKLVNVNDKDTPLNNINDPGKYEATYLARTPNGATATITRDVYVHGQVEAETNDLYIRRTDSDESSIYNIEKLFNEGYVSASVQHVEVDGTINKVSLDSNNMKIINSNFNTSVVGDNIIQIEVVDDKEPMAKTAATINVHVIDGLGDITITANSDVKVKTGTSEAEVKDVIQARAVQKVPISVDPSGEIDVTQLIQYDFTNYNPNSSDTYEVNLSVDSNGITSQKAINVYVDEIPVFRVDEKVYVVGDEFEELADITVEDKEDKIIDSKNINVIRSNVNMKIPDDYEIEYEVTDSIGNVARLVRVVHVINDELGYLTYSKSLFLTDNNGNVVENGQDVSEQYAGAKGFVRFDNKNDSKVMNIKVTVNSDLEIQNSSKSESYKVGMYDIQGNKLNINNMSLIEVGTLSEQNNLIEYWMNILKQDRMKKELFEGTATFNFTYER